MSQCCSWVLLSWGFFFSKMRKYLPGVLSSKNLKGVKKGWRDEGYLLGEWSLIRASAFWESLTRMASALKIKFPTLKGAHKRTSCFDCKVKKKSCTWASSVLHDKQRRKRWYRNAVSHFLFVYSFWRQILFPQCCKDSFRETLKQNASICDCVSLLMGAWRKQYSWEQKPKLDLSTLLKGKVWSANHYTLIPPLH